MLCPPPRPILSAVLTHSFAFAGICNRLGAGPPRTYDYVECILPIAEEDVTPLRCWTQSCFKGFSIGRFNVTACDNGSSSVVGISIKTKIKGMRYGREYKELEVMNFP